ncbi:hypothetical protein GGI11_007950 [Coemansia sp. RSA 2049]|nr:hypothetical protein GGI11_007950 [Coemansia sp. RSA 2049]
MMEGPTAQAQAQTNGGAAAGANGMYGGQQQHAGSMSGGPLQFSASQKPADPSVKSLYVGNLDPNVTEQFLREIFSSVRPVTNVKIIPDRRDIAYGQPDSRSG